MLEKTSSSWFPKRSNISVRKSGTELCPEVVSKMPTMLP